MKRKNLKVNLQSGIVREMSQSFFDIGDNGSAHNVIIKAIQFYPTNTDLADVLAKVTLINVLFGTAIRDIVTLSKHIQSKAKTAGLENQLKNGESAAIDSIRLGHGIRRKNKNVDLNFYSFATKYACFHNPKRYPIYDNLVKRLLTNANRAIHFDRFNQAELMNYETLRRVIDALRKRLDLTSMDYKEFDQGLWTIAKCLYDPNDIPMSLINKTKSMT